MTCLMVPSLPAASIAWRTTRRAWLPLAQSSSWEALSSTLEERRYASAAFLPCFPPAPNQSVLSDVVLRAARLAACPDSTDNSPMTDGSSFTSHPPRVGEVRCRSGNRNPHLGTMPSH